MWWPTSYIAYDIGAMRGDIAPDVRSHFPTTSKIVYDIGAMWGDIAPDVRSHFPTTSKIAYDIGAMWGDIASDVRSWFRHRGRYRSTSPRYRRRFPQIAYDIASHRLRWVWRFHKSPTISLHRQLHIAVAIGF